MVFDYKNPLNQAEWEPIFPFEEFRGFKVEIDNIHQYLDQNQPYNFREEFSEAFQEFKEGLVDLIDQALFKLSTSSNKGSYESDKEDYEWLDPKIKEITEPLLFPTILLQFLRVIQPTGGLGGGWYSKNNEPAYFNPHGTEVITDQLMSAALNHVIEPLEVVINPRYGLDACVFPSKPLRENIICYTLGTLGVLSMQEIEDILNDFDLVDEEKIRSSWRWVHKPRERYIFHTHLQRFLYDAYLKNQPKTIIDYLEESYAQDLEFNKVELNIHNQADFNKWVNYAYGLAILTFQMHINGETYKHLFTDANPSEWTKGLKLASIDPRLENLRGIISGRYTPGEGGVGVYLAEKWKEIEQPEKPSIMKKLKIFGRR